MLYHLVNRRLNLCSKNTMIKELHAATTGARDAYFGLPLNVLLEKEKGSAVPRLLVSAFGYG